MNNVQLYKATSTVDSKHKIIIIDDLNEIKGFCPNDEVENFVKEKFNTETLVEYRNLSNSIFFTKIPREKKHFEQLEFMRRQGGLVFEQLKKETELIIEIIDQSDQDCFVLAVAEGLGISSYFFDKYKKDQKQPVIHLHLRNEHLKEMLVKEYNVLIDALSDCRDLVNEPHSFLTAQQLSEELIQLSKKSGFDIEVWNEEQIIEENFHALLAVNKGSQEPPTFNILEYLPDDPINDQPYVLVGKGVVYDTGGVNLKSTASGTLNKMKSDMAGAATIASVISAISRNKLPLHVVGLIPATDNRPGANAIVPGDVIDTHAGKTVEIGNTDAEGRLILADALSYAKRYNPKLVIDIATLTGSAAMSLGREGVVYMGKAPVNVKNDFEQTGREVYERVIEFPLWDEYNDYIASSIADINNVGGRLAGAITAGKFLQHFTDYDWIHIDIAGAAYYDRPHFYRPKNASGVGVRLLYQFLKSQLK